MKLISTLALSAMVWGIHSPYAAVATALLCFLIHLTKKKYA